MRLRLLTFAFVLAAAGGCRTLQMNPVPPTPSDWTTEGRSGTRTGAVPTAVPLPLEPAWVYDATAGFGPGSALLLEDRLIVATRKGEVHAVDLSDGSRLGVASFGDAIEGTPVLSGTVVYVPIAWGRRALVAYDLTRGRTMWTHRHPPIEAGLLLQGGVLYGVDVEGAVRAYRPADGDTLWSYRLGAGRTAPGAPVGTAAGLLVADDRGRVTALDARGTATWTAELGAPVRATGAVLDGTAFFATTRGRLVALDAATGDARWRAESADTTVYFAAPAVDAGLVAVGGSDGVVRAFDPATGAARWTRDLAEAIVGAPLLTPDHVFVGTTGQAVYALDRATGAVAWEAEVEGRVRSAVSARDGRVVVLTDDRHVYLFAPTTSGYASTR